MSSGSASKLVNGENKRENVHGHEHGNKRENESGAAGSTASSIVTLAGDASDASTTATTTAITTTTSSSVTSTVAAAAAAAAASATIAIAATTVITVAAGGVVGTTGAGTTGTADSSAADASESSSSGSGDSGCGNGGSGCFTSGSDNGANSGSNSGVCVAGLTAEGVVGVEFCDVDCEDVRIPGARQVVVAPDEKDVSSSETGYSEIVFEEPYDETCIIGTPVVNLSTATTTTTTTTTTSTTTTTTTTTTITIIEHDDRITTTTVSAACYEEDEQEDNEEDDDNNMVAAMNEHLSTTSATSGVRSNTTVSTASTTVNPSIVNQGNSCCSRGEFENVDEDGKPVAGILSFPCDFDHMYASMTDSSGAPAVATATSALGVSPLRGNEPRQNDLTEVKHLKELLLLHLDLIQQQSEQIVTKDKLLAALRQENETLKLRLERMDRRVNLQKLRSESNENSIASEHTGVCSSPTVNSVNVPSTSELHRNIQPESNNSQYSESFKIRLNTSGGITTVKQEPNDNQSKQETKLETGNDIRLEWEEKKKRRTDSTSISSGSKRKRGVSCSSTISNDTSSSTVPDKTLGQENNRKNDRKGKPLTKKESFLTTEEHYYTAVGDPNYTLNLKEPNLVESDTSLEVPNWRVKIYTSCYTMEGTENLDDEIFNKRHLKLENDERRRKRWDVQRIREQRHIEKLKQRQERQNHQATCYNTNHTGPCPSTVEEEAVLSLWPDVEQIQSLQVDPQLPIAAFGAPIPSFTPSEFSLPWSNMSRSNSRRPKRSTGRRKSTRR